MMANNGGKNGAKNGAKNNGKTAATTARPADPCCLVIFGASGDLTHRLLDAGAL